MSQILQPLIWPLAALLLVSSTLARADEPAERKPTSTEATAEVAKAPRVLVTISKETTFITEPLDKDGNVDYLAALNRHFSQGVTPDNNGAVLYWQAIGPAEIAEEQRERFFQMLGTARLPEKGEYYVPLGTFAKRENAVESEKKNVAEAAEANTWEKQLEIALARPWSKDELPIIAAWLAANEKPLKLVVEASKRPRWYVPMLPDPLTLFVWLGTTEFRDVVRALVTRATLRMKSGQLDEAWQDLLASHRLARLASQGATVIDEFVAVSLEIMTCQGDVALVQHKPLTADQAARMLRDLQALPPMRGLGEKLGWTERFWFLSTISRIVRGDESLYRMVGIKDSVYLHITMNFIDWDIILRIGNSWYDRLVEAAAKPTPIERRDAFGAADEDLDRAREKLTSPVAVFFLLLDVGPTKAASQWLGQYYVNLFSSAVVAMNTVGDRCAVNLDVVRVALALAAYRAEHDAYPARLSELAPKYLRAIPRDLLTDDMQGDLIYQPAADGYLLYSVGRNGQDDGGRLHDYSVGSNIDWDDIAVRVPAAKKP